MQHHHSYSGLCLVRILSLAIFVAAPVLQLSALGQKQDGKPTKSSSPITVPADLNKKIDRLISELSSRKFLIREQATRALWEIGIPAEAKLRDALNSSSAEVVERAEAILSDFEYGIYATTDPSTKSTILAFRDGNLSQKKNAGRQLLAGGKVGTLIKLIFKEEDRRRVTPLVTEFFGNSRFVLKLIEDGEDQIALESLRLLNQYSAEFKLNAFRREALRSEYLWLASALQSLSGEADLIQQRITDEPALNDQSLLIRLLRAQSKSQKSLEVNLALDPTEARESVTNNLLIENHEWAKLSNAHWLEERPPVTELDVPALISGMTFHRLSGNQDRFEKDLERLYQFSDPYVDDLALDESSGLFERVNNTTIFMICEFLLTNGQIEKGLSYLQKTDRFKAFDAYVSVDDYKGAFLTLGLKDISPATAKIFERQIRAYRPVRWSDSTEDIERLTNVVHAFYQLGFFEEAKTLYRTLFSIAIRYEANQTGALEVVCQSLLLNDQKELFFELADSQLRQKNYDFALASLFAARDGELDGVTLASYWWTVLEMELPDKSPLERLKTLDEFLQPLGPQDQPKPQFKTWVTKIEKEYEQESGSWGDEVYLGFTYLVWNDREKAKSWLAKHDFKTSPSSKVSLQLGKLYYEDKQFDLAAQSYLNAWHFGDEDITGLFMAGVAQRQAGLTAESKKTLSLATKLMISSEDNRKVATALIDHELNSDARPLLETAMKVGDFQSWDVGTARFRYINLLDENESNHAANLLENQLLDVVATDRYYPSMSSYTYYPNEIELQKFNHQVVAENPELAYEAAKRALAIRPMSATVAEDYLPKLRALSGGEKLADELFESIRSAYKEELKSFPNSGLFNNNLAWINSTNKRHLDEALYHAELAVKNEPNNPTYMDTLADVCFNLGQVERAIELMEQCLTFDPHSEHYNEQIKRFRQKLSSPTK